MKKIFLSIFILFISAGSTIVTAGSNFFSKYTAVMPLNQIDPLQEIYKYFPIESVSHLSKSNISYKWSENFLIEHIFNYIDENEKHSVRKYTYSYENNKIKTIKEFISVEEDPNKLEFLRQYNVEYKDGLKHRIINFSKEMQKRRVTAFYYDNKQRINKIVTMRIINSPKYKERETPFNFVYKNGKLSQINYRNENYKYIYRKNKIIVDTEDYEVIHEFDNNKLIKKTRHCKFKGCENDYSEDIFSYDKYGRLVLYKTHAYMEGKKDEPSMWDGYEEYIYEKDIKIAEITAKSGLRIRKEPTINSAIITAVPYGDDVLVTEKSKVEEVIGGEKGNWVRVKWSAYRGWVFDAFLKYK